MKSTPVQQVKERFGDKAKLVAAVKKLATDQLWIDEVNPFKGLDHVPNSKLLRLHDVLEQVKKDFGTRAKLIDAILTLEKRSKDAGYKSRLEGLATPELVDLHGAATRRSRRAEVKASAKSSQPKAKKATRSKKAKAKAKAA